MWTLIAGRYASNPTVIGTDLLNEPGCGTVGLDPYYALATAAIRAVNPHVSIYFEDYIAGILAGGVSGVTRAPDPNSVYTFHVYRPDWARAEQTIAAFASRGAQLGVPLWLGEFDAFSSNRLDKPPASGWKSMTRKLFAYLDAHKISGWCYWAYQGVGSVFLPDGRGVDAALIRFLQSGFSAE